jgi:hypothetical protein
MLERSFGQMFLRFSHSSLSLDQNFPSRNCVSSEIFPLSPPSARLFNGEPGAFTCVQTSG